MVNLLTHIKNIPKTGDLDELNFWLLKYINEDNNLQKELDLIPKQINASFIEKYVIPNDLFFNRSFLHNQAHGCRVLILSENLMGFLGYSKKDVIRFSAITHDIAREHDEEDKSHGFKSSEWVMKNHMYLNSISPITVKELSHVSLLNLLHDVEDDQTPYGMIIPEVGFEKSIKIIRDADALDRTRDIKFLNKEFLRFSHSKNMVEIAWYLSGISQYMMHEYNIKGSESVLFSGNILGLVKEDRKNLDPIFSRTEKYNIANLVNKYKN